MYMKKEIETYLKRLVNEGVFPGCNYCLITQDETIYDSCGYKSLIPDKIENSLNNIYDIASLTKPLVTNTLISFLIRDGKLSLDDYVTKYLEDFKFDDVKIIHLLTHSSGIRGTFSKFDLKSIDEFTNSLIREFEPGTDIKYVDINYILLGFIIEKIYNESIDFLSRKLIFEPLEMVDTCYCPKDKSRCVPTELTEARGLVWGTVHDEKADFLNGVAGHAGIFSTVSDLSHFVQMILNGGNYKGVQFLDKKYIDSWFQPALTDSQGFKRTLGWSYGKSSSISKHVCSEDAIVHSGFTGCYILIDRTNNMAFILLSNRIHPSRDNNKLSEQRKVLNKEIYNLLKKYHRI